MVEPIHTDLGNSASQDFDICLRDSGGSFAENGGDLARLSCSTVKWPTSIAEICGDDESAQTLRRNISKYWLVKFPNADNKNMVSVITWCVSHEESLAASCN